MKGVGGNYTVLMAAPRSTRGVPCRCSCQARADPLRPSRRSYGRGGGGACGMRAGAIGLVARRHRVPELVFAPDSHPEHAHALLEDRRVPGRNPQSVLQCLCHEHTVERITMLPL
jgi:hypothetical protein